MAKHVKILEGHSVKEWEKKYANKIAKGKLKVFNKEEDLLEYAKYWKINGKYYQTTTVYEWYAKSLRKSKGLTIALTCTSILATFFLCTALIQSQIQWNEGQGYTVSLYANEGKFDDGAKSKTITGVKRGTKLKDVRDYEKKYIPSRASEGMEDYDFGNWYVDDGKDTTVFDEESEITDNIALKANYEMVPSKVTTTFKNDSWATVYHVIEQGKTAFINTYCKDYFNGSNDPEEALMNFMDSVDNWKTFSVGNVGDYGVRLIGVGQDKLAQGEEEVGRELFTFEFNECIQQVSYSYTQAGAPFYTATGAEDPEYTRGNDYCYLKKYYDSDLLPQFPEFIQKRIKTVEKRTLEIHGGFAYHHSQDPSAPEKEQDYDAWVFDRDECLTTGRTADKHLEMAVTKEKLFSLSIDEIGGGTIEFETPEGWENSKELMKLNVQADDEYLNKYNTDDIDAVGEGFREEIDPSEHNYRGAYMFYQREWDDTEGHNYNHKREKKYFIGDDPKGVETQYRLRSIYIPYEHDEDDFDTGKMGGNKDYRPFETWNVNDDGSIGNCKVSGTTKDGSIKWHFLAGDMAWAGIYVAPAFCL